jgi:glycerol uptake facilitator-like aquaporin
MTIYLQAKSDWVAPSQDFGLRAFTMMLVCYACTAMSQRISGGSFNPNVALATITLHVIDWKDTENLIFLIPYILAPLLSGLLAGIFMRTFAIKVTKAPSPNSPFLG